MTLKDIIQKYKILRYIKLIIIFKQKKKINCKELSEMNPTLQTYITEQFYTRYYDFDPYYGPSTDYYYVNPLWICRNVFKNNCHPGWGCNLCKYSGLRLDM
tara:strand:+ start:794 stop:1096 length:303 start_codon:yes stop_codon:yes gene_type:complete